MRLLASLLVLSLAACSSTPPPEPEVPEEVALADGLYLVVRKEEPGKAWPALQPGQERVRFEHEFMSEEARPREVLVLETGSMVPLVLAEAPVAGKSDKGFTSLSLTLAPEQKERLAKLTTDNVGRGVALLIGGRVASSHGIKAPITGGAFQISRCNDEACQFVLVRLRAQERR